MLSLYNTLSRKKSEFKPLEPHQVGMYTCGPTVYAVPQIGNYRSFLFSDILKRVLKYNGYQVKHVMNITDVDDKTILQSQRLGQALKDFTEYYTAIFLKDLTSLNILLPDVLPKATETIDDMVDMVKRLMSGGYAYQAEDKSIYFKISKFENYGQLACLKKQQLKVDAAGRLNSDEYKKEQVNDFVLWKAWQEKDGPVFWQTELGKGRPGWHIECSVMSMKHLGQTFDIHTGGEDLIFPHHTNEIAQSEAATGQPFVHYWLHGAFLTIDNKRMGKSEGNFIALADLIKKGYQPLAYRYLNLTAHYRSILNFTWLSLAAAQRTLNKLVDLYVDWPEQGDVNQKYQDQFMQLINDDLDMPKALALVWQLTKDSKIEDKDKKATLVKFDQVLGLGLNQALKVDVPPFILDLTQQREKARLAKDWALADKLRQQIESLGWLIEDTGQGSQVKQK